MPAGLTETLTRPELIDLVRFLSQLGKIGPFSVGTDRVLRRWQILEPFPELNSLGDRDNVETLLAKRVPLAWRPAYTTVAGFLPLSEWPKSDGRSGTRRLAVARGGWK